MFCLVEEIIYLKELKSLCLRKAKVVFFHIPIFIEKILRRKICQKEEGGTGSLGQGGGFLLQKLFSESFKEPRPQQKCQGRGLLQMDLYAR